MNKKINKLFIYFFVLFFNINVFAMNKFNVLDECASLIGTELQGYLNYIYTGLRIATPILIVVLVSMDMVKAVAAGDEKEMKKAQSDAFKRIIIGVVIMFIPTILNLIFEFVPRISGTCGIG